MGQSVIKSKRRLVAQSSSSGTYKDKLNSLYSAYNALSAEEKINSYIIVGEYKYYAVATNGRFQSMAIYYQGKFSYSVMMISQSASSVTSLEVSSSGNTITDYTTASNSTVFKLYTES